MHEANTRMADGVHYVLRLFPKLALNMPICSGIRQLHSSFKLQCPHRHECLALRRSVFAPALGISMHAWFLSFIRQERDHPPGDGGFSSALGMQADKIQQGKSRQAPHYCISRGLFHIGETVGMVVRDSPVSLVCFSRHDKQVLPPLIAAHLPWLF